ncbi:cGMP-dependent protein kinase 1 isoform 2 [Oopsacas minuta]|uniref:non-specific serine/threonine protein kinase n=1 Tax=Oopsacas minuta TaxID=111878 RepID=A0AAV7K522_9METZ|nr:cGMP-dependent protein kinase 1 isoform 2 [Oopsacas minuta]
MASLNGKQIANLKMEKIAKEGKVLKRGEHIHTWRPRYFILFEDGTLVGYKTKPANPGADFLNIFSVKGSQITKKNFSGKPGFTLRCLQIDAYVDRNFQLEEDSDRDEWCMQIERIGSKVSAQARIADTTNPDDMSQFTDPSKTKSKITLEDFELLKVLGKGTFGTVMLSKEKSSGEIFAIKVISKEMIIEKDEIKHTLTENKVLQQTKHPFLTGLKYSFQTKDKLCFVMEYVNGGELFFHLSRERRFSEDRSRFYSGEITLGLEYLHSHKIIYRDLKLENLLLDQEGHIKLTDFGLCKQDIAYGDTTSTFCGTPEYLAPEVIEDDSYGLCVDWWSLGVVLYEMICGRLPFYHQDHDLLFEVILTKPVRFPHDISGKAMSVLEGLLRKDPSQRLGGGKDGPAEVKSHPFFASIDWEKLFNKEIDPPFKPKIKSVTDVSYFDTEFTSENPQKTLAAAPVSTSMGNKMENTFPDFTFVDKDSQLK